MDISKFTPHTIYTIYIAASAEQVWKGLTESGFTTRYFFGRSVESDWSRGSPWLLRMPDGRIDVEGTVRTSEPPHRLELSWNVAWLTPKLPECFVTYTIEAAGDGVTRLTMTETHPTPIPAALLEGGRQGWPMILSGLKSVLETGTGLKIAVPKPPEGMQENGERE